MCASKSKGNPCWKHDREDKRFLSSVKSLRTSSDLSENWKEKLSKLPALPIGRYWCTSSLRELRNFKTQVTGRSLIWDWSLRGRAALRTRLPPAARVTEPCSTREHYYSDPGRRWLHFSTFFPAHKQVTGPTSAGLKATESPVFSLCFVVAKWGWGSHREAISHI